MILSYKNAEALFLSRQQKCQVSNYDNGQTREIHANIVKCYAGAFCVSRCALRFALYLVLHIF